MTKKLTVLLTMTLLLGAGIGARAQFISNNGIQLTNSGVVSTNGDWQNNAESVIINDGTISTTDDFVNDGILTTSGAGGFHLNYSATHQFKPGATVLGYISKSGTGNVDMTGNIAIKDSLVMQKGSIKLIVPDDTLTFMNNALVDVALGCFVEGKVAHEGTGNKIFPIGTDGTAMPLKLYKANVTKATASLIPKPVGAGVGAGLDSLSTLTHCWRVDEKVLSDTAAYVELSFPAALIPVNNAVVSRYNAGLNDFSSMGARVVETAGGMSRIVSYSRGMKGIYSVAYGIPVNRVQDSLALRAFYLATGGENWNVSTNWMSEEESIETWAGLQFAGQALVGIDLNNNNLVGSVPESFVDLGALTTINFHGNELTSIPDFSVNSEIESLDVSVNRLTFASLEPNAGVPGLVYTGQTLGEPLDELIEVGSPFHLEFEVGGENTTYVWKRNGEVVEGSNTLVVDVESINRNNMGSYVLEATNTLFPGYTLASEVQKVLAYANVGGNFTINDEGAETGSIRILRVTPVGAFEPTDTVAFETDGSFFFEKVVLGDYQLVGFADTLTYEDALPTYYGNTLFWEEADTLAVDNHITGLAIESETKPDPTTGPGLISGYLEEEVEEGGRNMVPKRVSGAGASVRRGEGSGRGKENLILVGYTFTDEDGNFTFDGLPNGEYLINLQYPGYPMDESSDLHLNIEDAFRSEIMVGARVIDNKINVQKITITNIYETVDYNIQLFPNPAVEYLKVRFAQKSNARTVQLTSITGQNLINLPANELESVVDIKGMKRGIYLFQVQENGHVVKTVKVSIE